MAKKKKKKRSNGLARDAARMAATGMTAGVAGNVAYRAGSPQAAAGISRMTGYMPIAGSAMGAGHALKHIKKVGKKKKRRR